VKKVLRSCFDPLPRFLSTRGLAGVVVMLLGGTALSVYEYVESTRPPPRRAAPTAPAGAVHAAERTPELRERCRSFADLPPVAPPPGPVELGPAARVRSEPSPDPSIWEPDEGRSGS
jgi:hypothetical protein